MPGLKCPKCNGDKFFLKNYILTRNGNKYNTLAWCCNVCSEPSLDREQRLNLIELIKEYENVPLKTDKNKETKKISKKQKKNSS